MALFSFPCAPRRVSARTFSKFLGTFSFFFLFGRARARKFDLFACFVFFAYFSAFFAILVAAEKFRVWREVAINVPEILEIPEFLK